VTLSPLSPLSPLRRRRLLIPKRTKRPLPSYLFVALRESAWRVQVIGVHSVVFAAGVGGNGHRAGGGGQVDVVGAACAVGSAATQLVEQAAVFIVVVLVAQFVARCRRCHRAGGSGRAAPQAAKEVDQRLHDAGVSRVAAAGDGGELGLGFEQALAQGVVHVPCGGGVHACTGGDVGQAACGVELVAAQAVAGHGAVGVVLVVHRAGGCGCTRARCASSRMRAHVRA
jgi:hypothetical protein